MRLCLALLLILSAVLCVQGNVIKSKKPTRPARKHAVKDYVSINNQTFFFGINDEVNWYDAYYRCESLGMQLLTLDSFEKEKMIFDWLELNPDYDYWLCTAGWKPTWTLDWNWVTSRENFTYTYTNWGLGQPSRDPDAESCMNFAAWWGGWDDDPCLGGFLYSWEYVCEEIPAK